MKTEGRECAAVGRHCMVPKVAHNDLREPFPLDRNWLVHSPSQLPFDLLELGPHAVASGLPFDLELALASLTAHEREAQEIEGLRLSESLPFAISRGIAAKLNQSGLSRMQRQRKLLQPISHRVQETSSVGLVLKTNDDIVGIAHDDHVARGLAPSPAFRPEIENVVKVDVGKER